MDRTRLESNTSRLVEINLATGTRRSIAADRSYDVPAIPQHPRTKELQAVGFLRSALEWDAVDPKFARGLADLRAKYPGEIRIESRDRSDSLWTVRVSASDRPPCLYLYDRKTSSGSLLFESLAKLKGYELATMEPISFAARDGLTMHGYFTPPPGGARKAPTVLLVHGGPWSRDTFGFKAMVQFLANRGYAILQVNFRGSAGYGKDFLNAGDREWGGKMQQDLIDAKRWAVGQDYSDPDRFAIVGGSYGGYATLAALAFTPEEFACGVDMFGPSDLITFRKAMPSRWDLLQATFDRRIGSVQTDEAMLRQRSPITAAANIARPLLVLQGANDTRVKISESDQIVRAVRDNGGVVEYIVFPGEGHGLIRPQHNRQAMAVVDSFLAKYLGGRAEPVKPEDDWTSLLH